jgi:hypothetical protein
MGVQTCVAVLYCFIVAMGGFLGWVIADILLSRKDTRSWTASTGPTFYYRWDLGGWSRSLHDMDIEEDLKLRTLHETHLSLRAQGMAWYFSG